jgi:type IV secretion system protein VirB10
VLHHKGSVVAQGAMIAAVLETALDSDLQGFARAVVSRDVRSFDGMAVLIPRGSRVIGEYRPATAQGQTRAFVIWTRVLRPDGVSIQIGSPATDPLGRAGLSGSVDTHFFERFGGAILLSVVNAGATALAGSPSTEVVVGSSQQATGLAATASAFAPQNIAPTIKVPQGSPIRIFVARDLEFTNVGAP